MKNRIRQVRTAAGLTQALFAKRLNVSTSTVCIWENEGRVSKAGLAKISKVFGVNLLWLKTGEGSPSDTSKNSENIGDRLRYLRAGLGLTQEDLAKKIGVSKMTVVFWERDGNIPKKKQLIICNKLGANPEWLETGEGVMTQGNAQYKYESPRQFAERNGCNSFESAVFERFFELPVSDRRAFLHTATQLFAGTVPIAPEQGNTNSVSISGPISVKDLYRSSVNIGGSGQNDG